MICPLAGCLLSLLSCGLDNVNTARLLCVNKFLGFPLENGITFQTSVIGIPTLVGGGGGTLRLS